MAENTTGDEQKTTPASTPKTAPATKPAAEPHGTGEEPTPGGVHRPGRRPGEFTDHGPVTMPVRART